MNMETLDILTMLPLDEIQLEQAQEVTDDLDHLDDEEPPVAVARFGSSI